MIYLLYILIVSQACTLCWSASCELKWVKTDHHNLPDHSVLVIDKNPAGDFYVARSSVNGVLTPGRFNLKEETFFYTMDGKEYGIKENFEVLTNPNNCHLSWRRAYGGTLPRGSIEVGNDKQGGKAYSARYHEQFGWMVGKFYKSTNLMYYGWGGGENSKPSYEILVLEDIPFDDTIRPKCNNARTFDHDNFVCVCSESQPCDKIEATDKTPANVVNRWTTSFYGHRLTKDSLRLDDKSKPVPIETGDQSQVYIKVNRDVKFQEIIGFGGAFTDATGINIKAAGPKLADNIIADYFSIDGIEYNMGRIPMGGSDFSTRGYTYDDNGYMPVVEDKTLSKFALQPEDLDYKIPYIQKAQSLATHPLKVFGSPWSAPGWMKESYYKTEPVVGGHIKGPVGGEYWQIYATYFVKYLEAYKQHNITHWGVTVQNEPLAGVPWNSMGYNAESERDFVATTLGPILERSGWGPDRLKVMMLDHNVGLVKEWVDKHYSNPTAAKYTAGTAIHWYGHDPKTMLDAPHAQHPDKWILATEACVEGGVKLGAWDSFDLYADDIIQDLLHWVTGWVDWNMALDLKGGPNWKNNFVDAPILVDAGKKEYYRQPMYYALGHFSKFLPPGSVRVETQVVNNNNNHLAYAVFRTPDSATVIVTYNREGIDVDLVVEDPKSSGKLIQKVAPLSLQTWVYYD
ncbi:putative glucosylceramidase 3 [Oppia nitens]|uniref:putative glucosylceramidase 3 n=1 Tax=Oppia nitens TaxID=1686743 RepID=UPI0023DB673B|nr:putative glucosylceramidase 3 [Oppia nitens]